MTREHYQGDYAHMMHEGEDTEEFTLRLIREVEKVDKETGRIWINTLNMVRTAVLNRQVSHEQHDADRQNS
jgi:hypothetical protein